MKFFKLSLIFAIVAASAISASAQLLLNEIKVNPPGSDNPYEFIELKGTPGSTINNTYLCVFESDSASAGHTDLVVRLNNITLGSNGLYFVASSIGYNNIQAPTIFRDTAIFSSLGGIIENGSSTFALIFSTTPIVYDIDYDTNNDGVLELPAGAAVLDAVGWISAGSTGSLIYEGITVSQVAGTPDAAVRFFGNNTPKSSTAWYCGDLTGTAGSSTTFDALELSANFPAGGALSPGDFNLPNTNSIFENQKDVSNFNYYPNPASTYLVINNIKLKDTIEIFDMMGSLMYREQSANSGSIIQLTNFSNGLYFVKVTSKDKSATKKLIVSR